jgi:predicted RNA-binding Zn ribbon-like protein
MQIRAHQFRPSDLVAGHVVLDLANTVTARGGEPGDWLDSFRRVLEWAALTGHFDRGVLAQLERMDRSDPAAGELSLRHLRDLRETTHATLVAIIRSGTPAEATLTRFEAFWKDAVTAATLTSSEFHVSPELDLESSGLDYVTHALALQAFEFLQAFPIDRTRVCAGTNCGWLFLDRSKGGQRRWCDMAVCGNLAKSRRHYERKRAARLGRRR